MYIFFEKHVHLLAEPSLENSKQKVRATRLRLRARNMNRKIVTCDL